MAAAAKIFLSTVSNEFRPYRDQLRSDLTRPNVEVKVQEDFKDQGRGALDAFDVYIAGCDAVVHLAGDMTGSAPSEPALSALRAKYPDLGRQAAAARRGAAKRGERLLSIRNGKLGLRSIMASSCSSPRPPTAPNAARNTRLRTPRAPPRPRIFSASRRWTAIPAALS